jgi:hypothetical protein
MELLDYITKRKQEIINERPVLEEPTFLEEIFGSSKKSEIKFACDMTNWTSRILELDKLEIYALGLQDKL